MKKSKLYVAALAAFALIACEGPAGADGLDGVNILGQVVEFQGTFNSDNDYSLFYEFPNTVEVFESDVVLVYMLWEQVDDPNGGAPIDVWRLMPQTRILDQGLLQYNYDHTFLDVSVFLEADSNFDFSTLLPGDTDNQIFRVAIVPAEFAQDTSLDLSNLSDVMGALAIDPMNLSRESVY